MKKYDVVILGGGPAGRHTCSDLFQLNKKVCLIEMDQDSFGGVCVNKGCMPTKHLVKAAEVVETAKKAYEFGVEVPSVKPQMDQIFGEKEILIKKLRARHKKQTPGEIIIGHGRFIDNNTVEITLLDGSKEQVTAEQFVIATGSRPKLIPGINIDGKYIYTSDEFLDNNEIPDKLLVVGGGVIGLEFASIYKSYGSDVSVVEFAPAILPTEDIDSSIMIKDLLQKRGINIFTTTGLEKAEIINGKVVCSFTGDYNNTESFDKVLISIGRQPNTDDIGLENTDLKVEKGFIRVNDYLQTDVPHIYAAGDVVSTLMLAHTAIYESMIVSSNMINPGSMPYNNKIVPKVVFTKPEVASVGLTEKEAQERYESIKVINFSMMKGKNIIDHMTEGRIKLIYKADNGVIIGASIIGNSATELIHELTLAVNNGLTIDNLKNTVHAHPTISEVIWYAALNGQPFDSTQDFMVSTPN